MKASNTKAKGKTMLNYEDGFYSDGSIIICIAKNRVVDILDFEAGEVVSRDPRDNKSCYPGDEYFDDALESFETDCDDATAQLQNPFNAPYFVGETIEDAISEVCE